MTHMQTKQFNSVWIDTKDHGRLRIDKRFAIIKGRFFLPYACTDFVRPDWMTADFPLHRWYERDNDEALAHLAARQPCHARYVEWFTRRDFYAAQQADVLETPRTGLYFVDDIPVVIHRQYQEREARS